MSISYAWLWSGLFKMDAGLFPIKTTQALIHNEDQLWPPLVVLKDGTNFMEWHHYLKNNLLIKGLWLIVNETETRPPDIILDSNNEELVSWNKDRQVDFDQRKDCALGIIGLSIHYSLQDFMADGDPVVAYKAICARFQPQINRHVQQLFQLTLWVA